jgi:hypothetical protein
MNFDDHHFALLSRNLNGLPPFEDITAARLLYAAFKWSVSPVEVIPLARDLSLLGFLTPSLERDSGPVKLTDRHIALLSKDLGGEWPFVSEVSFIHILRAARTWSISVTEVIEIAQSLSPTRIKVPAHEAPTSAIEDRVIALFSSDLDGRAPFLDRLTLPRLLSAAEHWSLPVEELLGIARAFGVAEALPQELGSLDAKELDRLVPLSALLGNMLDVFSDLATDEYGEYRTTVVIRELAVTSAERGLPLQDIRHAVGLTPFRLPDLDDSFWDIRVSRMAGTLLRRLHLSKNARLSSLSCWDLACVAMQSGRSVSSLLQDLRSLADLGFDVSDSIAFATFCLTIESPQHASRTELGAGLGCATPL